MEYILYTNYFKAENKTFAFKKSVLFDITNTPTKLDLKDTKGFYKYGLNIKHTSKQLLEIYKKEKGL
jgi:hypothetical protein